MTATCDCVVGTVVKDDCLLCTGTGQAKQWGPLLVLLHANTEIAHRGYLVRDRSCGPDAVGVLVTAHMVGQTASGDPDVQWTYATLRHGRGYGMTSNLEYLIEPLVDTQRRQVLFDWQAFEKRMVNYPVA